MQKLLGAIFVITGFLGMGYSYMEKEKQKIFFTQIWDNVLDMFSNEIAYKKQSLAFATYEISQKIGGKEGECFRRIYPRMTKDHREKFAHIWMEEWDKYLKNRNATERERKLVEEFTAVTGFDDEEILVKMIDEQQKKWRELRKEIVEGQQERKKIVWTLSVCSSLMLILILL